MTQSPHPQICIVVVAYNAEATLVKTLDRIPQALRSRLAEVIICDDASHDDTFEQARMWANAPDSPKTSVVKHTKNLGYGGNQKAAYQVAIDHGLDIVVLLHGDGQYAPECLPDLLAPFESLGCDAVFGSRMMDKGAARRGGMPAYKRWGNRILTTYENRMLGSNLSEFHSGYRAYTTDILRRIPFEANSDGFDFDTQIIIQILHAGGQIHEVPIPTYYGDEICYVNGLGYARDVALDVLEYRVAVRGFGTSAWISSPDDYAFKEHDGSSHAVILEMAAGRPPSKVLDLGCAGGYLAEKLRAEGHYVVGVDQGELGEVRGRTDEFYVADLSQGVPAEAGTDFDVIILGDVIEHLARPLDLMRQVRDLLRPGGQVLLSVPNFGHWYPRARVGLGLFGYDRRGILDSTHLRFFSRANLRRLIRTAGFDILEETATGLPLGVITDGGGLVNLVRRADAALVRTRPTLFGYQYLLRLTRHAEETIWADELT